MLLSRTLRALLFTGAALSISSSVNADYSNHPKAAEFISTMKAEGFTEAEVKGWLAQAEKRDDIIELISRPAEKSKEWKDYRKIFVTQSRTDKGVKFWAKHKDTLARAEKEFGVPAQVIVAIIGVETRYGGYMGSHRVIDALSTLAFDYPKRSPFFTKELKEFLLLVREQQQDLFALKGSYAGAMGYGQFMPSSFRAYAVDFDGDGIADIWTNPTDAIGSVANYFKRHGWQTDQPVVSRARIAAGYNKAPLDAGLKAESTIGELAEQGYSATEDLSQSMAASPFKLEGQKGAEFWLGLDNFYVITRYNRSRMYALSVHQLSEQLAQAAVREKIVASR